jgi:hypothetical protein
MKLQWKRPIAKNRKSREPMELDEYAEYASGPDGLQQPWYATASFWTLVTANVVTIVWAMREELQISVMVWVFWCQNIILGLFWPAKVFASSPDSSYAKKVKSVCAFIPQYMIMNLIYAFILYNLLQAQLAANLKSILIMAGVIFLSETVSHVVGTTTNRNKQLSLATVHLFPYARILPMHLLLPIGILAETAEEFAHISVLFLLSLKMIADVAMHIVEQKKLFGNHGIYSPKPERKVCGLCHRQFDPHEKPRKIKTSIVCQNCFTKIQLARKDTNKPK